ncbi:hypothetical protein [Streptomyces sp. SAI-126]|uniref:hypothetical protein n=1 Tax=Streptomyces sp. SAI-126 TaxID=3377732 RepID=UPI003C7D22F2
MGLPLVTDVRALTGTETGTGTGTGRGGITGPNTPRDRTGPRTTDLPSPPRPARICTAVRSTPRNRACPSSATDLPSPPRPARICTAVRSTPRNRACPSSATDLLSPRQPGLVGTTAPSSPRGPTALPLPPPGLRGDKLPGGLLGIR